MRGEVWTDPRTVIGASDAGAHLDMIDTFAFSTQVLEHGVRERGLISLEQAVHQLTEVPARLVGLKDRGQLREGFCADVVIFDAATIASGPTHTRFDLPGGVGRLYAEAAGRRARDRERTRDRAPRSLHGHAGRQDPALGPRHRHRGVSRHRREDAQGRAPRRDARRGCVRVLDERTARGLGRTRRPSACNAQCWCRWCRSPS